MSARFGRGILATLLRYSILFYFAHDIPISNKRDGMDGRYRRLAINALRKKLCDCSIQEADLFAAYFLALRAEWHSSVSIRHYEGCIGMYKFIAGEPARRTELFNVYAPFILHEFSSWLNMKGAFRSNLVSSQSREIHWTPFNLFVQHVTPFSCDNWLPLLLALALRLWYYSRLLGSLIVRVIKGQGHGNTETNCVLREALKYQFNEVGLQKVVTIAKDELGSAIKQNSVEHFAPLLLLVSWALGIRIGLEIVEAGHALHGLRSKTVQMRARKLVNYPRAYPEGHVTTISVLLAGLGLRKMSPDDGKEELIRFC